MSEASTQFMVGRLSTESGKCNSFNWTGFSETTGKWLLFRLSASRTMAHGHETLTEIIGTDGRLTVGREGRMNQVQISDAHGIRTLTTPTFYERFAEAFLREDSYFVDCVRNDAAPSLSLRDATEATRIGIALRTSLEERRMVEL